MKKLKHKHPGEILKNYFMGDMGITGYRLAKEAKISQIRVSEIIHGKRLITVNSALRLSKFFGNSFEFWMNLQNSYDKSKLKQKEMKDIESIHKFSTV